MNNDPVVTSENKVEARMNDDPVNSESENMEEIRKNAEDKAEKVPESHNGNTSDEVAIAGVSDILKIL